MSSEITVPTGSELVPRKRDTPELAGVRATHQLAGGVFLDRRSGRRSFGRYFECARHADLMTDDVGSIGFALTAALVEILPDPLLV